MDEVVRLVVRFKVPLQGAEAVTDDIHREFTEMMDYAVSFILCQLLSIEVFGGGCLMLQANLIGNVHYFLSNCCFPYPHQTAQLRGSFQ